MAGDASRIGIYGFGAAAHIVAQLARHEGREIAAFTRPGDAAAQAFAREHRRGMGRRQRPGAAVRARCGTPVCAGRRRWCRTRFRAVRKGGTVVCAGIHMSDIPQFPYALLWGERTVVSVANLTRRDGEEFIAIAGNAAIRTHVVPYPLEQRERSAGRLTPRTR